MPSGHLGTIPEQPEQDVNPSLSFPFLQSSCSHHSRTPTHSVNRSTPYTPSNIIRILISHPSATNTGSFPLSNSLLKSSAPIQAPIIESLPDIPSSDWDAGNLPFEPKEYTKDKLAEIIRTLAQELTLVQAHLLACDGMITQLQAQLIIQNIHLLKMNTVLVEKEKGKEGEGCLKLYPGGFSCLLTDDDFIALQEEAVEKRNKHAVLEEQKCQWDIIRQQHNKAGKTHKAECAKLKSLGVKRSSWLKAPKRKRKPTVDDIHHLTAPVLQNLLDVEGEESGEESEDGKEIDSEKEFWKD
ncbi:hypothetical protein M422DRAFT_270706 [Sphaerobolus stellatus SS14]|uniref:Uncharacterized protein n=1 Tax=Sphaerobolus stellatus (strain SS14) TaxID=990650 RepID=A0A0C9URS5_SPHS4|nr:hypothetical protein M422DRAFT_270706 [Sphaerobolus stellatus SS14]